MIRGHCPRGSDLAEGIYKVYSSDVRSIESSLSGRPESSGHSSYAEFDTAEYSGHYQYMRIQTFLLKQVKKYFPGMTYLAIVLGLLVQVPVFFFEPRRKAVMVGFPVFLSVLLQNGLNIIERADLIKMCKKS